VLAGEGDTAVPPASSQARPGGALGYSHFVFEELGGEVVTTLVEGPAGEQVRSNLSYLRLKQIYDQGDPPPEELRMTRDELGELVGQLDTVRQATDKYHDVEVALDEGYVASPEQFPNMGAHFVHPMRTFDGVFNPAEPEFLLYIRDETEEWELVGTGFLLPTQLVGEDHPDGFAGPMDNWHVHYSLCLGGRAASRSASTAECREQGGTWVSSLGWMIHSYVWVDNPLGVFGMWNPNIPPLMPAAKMRETRSLHDPLEGEVATTIENFQHPSPQIQVGETLIWTNMDGLPHTVTLGSRGVAEPGFDSGLMGPGQSFSVKFDRPGSYAFTCTLHPAMNGEIVVTE
jgi:plastocyanin